MNIYIITGTSRGLGLALSSLLCERGDRVYGLSRSKGVSSEYHVACDLSDEADIESALDFVFKDICFETATSIILINNAADLTPIVPIEKITTLDISRNLRINLLAPVMLTSNFMQKTQSYSGPKLIVNITSKAAHVPFDGLSLYCISKIGLEQLTKCVACEQENVANPVRIVSIDPGKMDTTMQQSIRSANPMDFPAAMQYREHFQSGRLSPPHAVAEFIDKCVHNEQLKSGQRYAFEDVTE